MKHLELIGAELKCDALNELFETFVVDVVYRYDRINGNQQDEYIAQIPQLGLEFLFDSRQKLSALFIKSTEVAGFNPFEEDHEGLPRFISKPDAIAHARQHDIQLSEGCTDFLGTVRDWVRLDHSDYSVHYEFVDSKLEMITIQTRHA